MDAQLVTVWGTVALAIVTLLLELVTMGLVVYAHRQASSLKDTLFLQGMLRCGKSSRSSLPGNTDAKSTTRRRGWSPRLSTMMTK